MSRNMANILSFVICNHLEIGLTLFVRYRIHVLLQYFGHPEQPVVCNCLLSVSFVLP